MQKLNSKDKSSVCLYAVIFLILVASLASLWLKTKNDLNNPFTYQMHLEQSPQNGISVSDTVMSNEGVSYSDNEYSYTVNMSKHWLNDPNGPLQTYGAQYDNTIFNHSDYDIVNWSVVIYVPERNITIDSSWNGRWDYDKTNDIIYFSPNDINATISSGSSVTFGAVLISEELMDFEDVTFTGCKYRKMTAYPLFWLIIAGFVAWVTAVIAFIRYLIREEDHRKYNERLGNVISQTMSTFANFIDTKDEYTKGHSTRVSYYSQKIAEKLGMSEEEVRDIGYIGLMHDCGKLAIPGLILNKPGKLTPEEFDQMRSHTTNGEKILKDFTAIDGIIDGALYHHERYDGKGYMAGLAGEDIPLVARIIGVADALDAMNSDRCYRKHLSKDIIINELESNKGTQFDPGIAQLMIDMIKSGEVFVGDGKD